MRTINNSFISPPLTSDLIDSAAATADVARRMRRRCVRRLDARPVLPVTDSTHKFKPKPRARQMAAQRCQLDNNLSNGWRGGVGPSSGYSADPLPPCHFPTTWRRFAVHAIYRGAYAFETFCLILLAFALLQLLPPTCLLALGVAVATST